MCVCMCVCLCICVCSCNCTYYTFILNNAFIFQCVGTCGKGVQKRNVTCMGLKMCKPELKPRMMKDCYLDPCPGSPEANIDDKTTDKHYVHNDYNKGIYNHRPVAIIGVDSLHPHNDPDAERDRAGILDMEGTNGPNDEISHLKHVSNDDNTVDPSKFKWVPMAWESVSNESNITF